MSDPKLINSFTGPDCCIKHLITSSCQISSYDLFHDYDPGNESVTSSQVRIHVEDWSVFSDLFFTSGLSSSIDYGGIQILQHMHL